MVCCNIINDRFRTLLLSIFVIFCGLQAYAQGNKLSIQVGPPSKLSICGINDTAFIQVYNISSGGVSGLKVTVLLPPGVIYVAASFKGGGLSEFDISNLNAPIFSAPNLGVARNFYFSILLSSDCGLYNYMSGNNAPVVSARIDYSGNYDVGASVPFSAKVPSVNIATIVNQTFTGSVGDYFARKITIGNYGKGPLKSLTLLRINGSDVKTFYSDKGVTQFKNDSIIKIFTGADFKKIGNLDTFLDQNETFVITDSSRILGCNKLTTTYELFWGCGNSICQIVKNSGIVLLSSGGPNIVAIPVVGSNLCYKNKTNKQLLKITNNGQKLARNTSVFIAQAYGYEMSKFDTSSIYIKKGWNGALIKKPLTNIGFTYNIGYYSCLGKEPISSFQLQIGDILPKDTFYILFDNKTCVDDICSFNFYTSSWQYSYSYTDICNNKQTVPAAWGKYYSYNIIDINTYTPTDLVNNQTGVFRHLFTSASLLPIDKTAAYQFDIVLPPGLVHSKSINDLFFNDATLNYVWKPDSIGIKGDTVRGYFSNLPFNLFNAELIYNLKADCSKNGANGNKTINTIFRYSPTNTCAPREWFSTCNNFNLKIHCTSNCLAGLKFENFSVSRTNFGKPDNNNDGTPDNSGTLDFTKIRPERAMFGDTIKAVFQGRIIRSRTITSWRYLFAESNIPYGNNLSVVGVKFVLFRGSNQRIACTNISYKKIVSGTNANFIFYLSIDSIANCVSNGFDYKQMDSVSLEVSYRVSGNIGQATVTSQFKNLFYTSNVANPNNNSNKFQCDTFSGQFVLNGYIYYNYGPENYAINSCNQINISQNFYFGIGSNSLYAGNNTFPFEYRNFARVKEVICYLPTSLKLERAYFGQYRTTGTNQNQFQYKDTIPYRIVNNNYLFEVSQFYKDSAKGKINLSDDAFQGIFNMLVTPTCELPNNQYIPIKYDFMFEKKGSMPKGIDTLSSLIYTDYVIYNKPIVSIKPTIPINYATSDTAEWEVVYSNLSNSFSNLNTWFSPDNSGAIKIVEIRDALTNKKLPETNQIYQAGIIPFSGSRKFKVRAIFNSCNNDSVIIFSGWNCKGYPKDLASYSCQSERIALYLEPQNTQFQVSISDSINSVNLCSQTPFYYLLENIGATAAQNTKAILTLPIGMTIENGKSYIQYPSNTWSALPAPQLITGTTYAWDLSTVIASLKNGFKGVFDTSRNKLLIKFYVKTDCNYSSGNYIRASASATIKCGNPVLVFPSISRPINIIGVTKPYFSLLNAITDSILPCEKNSRIKVKIINVGPGKTGIEDKYQVLLPAGIHYDSASYLGLMNAPNNLLTKSKDINGATEIEFSLKDSIVPGDSTEFLFNIITDSKIIKCGTVEIYNQAVVKQSVLCVENNTICKINVVTGNSLLKLPVSKADLQIISMKSKLKSFSSDSEFVQLNYTLKNLGNNITSGLKTKLNYFYDKNTSGTIDSGDILVGSFEYNNALKKDSMVNISTILAVKAGYSCGLFLVIDSSSCVCNFNQFKIPTPLLANAGKDIAYCSGSANKIGLPKSKGFTYNWQPAIELKSDTTAETELVFKNTTNNSVKKRYVLTTKRLTCLSRDTVFVTINSLPDIKLSQTDTTICEKQSINIGAKVKGGNGVYIYKWLPSNLVKDSNKLNTKAFGLKTNQLKLTVKDTFGCRSSDSFIMNVKPKPMSNFTYSNACVGQIVQLKDSSTIAEDSILYNRWTNIYKDTLNSKTWQVSVPKTMSTIVQLISESPFGCKDTVNKTVVTNPLPKANFTSNYNCLGDSTHLKNISVGNIAFSYWKLGDGSISKDRNPVHLYQTADTFDLFLKVETAFGCLDSINGNISVYNKPKADFTASNTCLGDSSFFKNNSFILNDSITNYNWLLSDGYKTNAYNLIYLFKTQNSYDIKLIAKTGFGCMDSITKTITTHPLPIAKITLDTVCFGTKSGFKSNSKIASGSIVKHFWLLQNGDTSNKAQFNYLYLNADTLLVKYTATSDKGCTDSANGFSIVHQKITPIINSSDNCLDDSSSFFNKSIYSKTRIKHSIWKLSTTDSMDALDAKYLFSSFGTKNIELKIESSEGCKYDTSAKIFIHPKPIVSFNNTNQCRDNQFVFAGNASIPFGTIDSTIWSFDDSSFAYTLNIGHSFPNSGTYTVVLKAKSNFGCTDTAIQTINSYPPVVAAFVTDSVCLGESIQFKDASIVPNATISKYSWQFGDGGKDKVPNPVYLYKKDSLFKVKLQITTSYNCTYDTVGYALVYPVPTSIFTTNPNNATILNPVIFFQNHSIGATSMKFLLSNGAEFTQDTFSYYFKDSGLYNITQWVSNQYGCKDSSSKQFYINYILNYYLPNAFSPNEDNINNILKPIGTGIAHFEMIVANRWGEIVYDNKESKGWDGKYKGELVEQGSYVVFYKIKSFKGQVNYRKQIITLLR